MKNINNELALLGFSFFEKIGPVKLKLLDNYFSNFAEAFLANALDLEKSGLKQKLISDFIIWREKFDFEKIINELKGEDIKYIIYEDPNYPKLLKEITNPPYLLYYKGNITALMI